MWPLDSAPRLPKKFNVDFLILINDRACLRADKRLKFTAFA